MLNRITAHARRSYLNETALIERRNITISPIGEAVETWVVTASSVPCRVIRGEHSRRDLTSTAGAREHLQEMYRVALPYNTTVGIDYRITVGEDVYTVVGMQGDLTDPVFIMVVVTKKG